MLLLSSGNLRSPSSSVKLKEVVKVYLRHWDRLRLHLPAPSLSLSLSLISFCCSSPQQLRKMSNAVQMKFRISTRVEKWRKENEEREKNKLRRA